MILAQRSPANPSLQQRAQTTTLASSKDDAASSIGRQVAGQSSNSSSGSGGIIKETQLHSPSAHLPSMFETGGSTNTAAAAVANNTTEDIYAQAIERTLLWVGAALLFGTGLWVMVGPTTAEEFFAGYLVEQSLSVDNLFVFLVLFEYFRVPLSSQGRVLNWGIFGAIIMRSIMIGLGAAALQHFHELLLLFAAILIYSSANSLISLAAGPDEGEDEEDLSQNAIVKFSRSLIPSTDRFDGDRFFTVVDGIKKATPLFICMIAVEVSDVVFAVDSIPAVFGVTEVREMHGNHAFRNIVTS
jgi:predicted tellurium resistance membrane protein TerC